MIDLFFKAGAVTAGIVFGMALACLTIAVVCAIVEEWLRRK